MCGIIGLHLKNKIKPNIYINAINSLKHRGPDDQGLWFDNQGKNLCLGQSRLSIIDLSEKSNQPMKDINEDYIIVFNGEVYNFKEIKSHLIKMGQTFRTKSDTEVLLEAYKFWGKKCLDKLEGMFAFAVYDRKKNKIFIARDRAGEKPLFYFYNGYDFIFASEIKAIFEIPSVERKINYSHLNLLLAQGYINKNRSIIHNINKLPAGNFLEYDIKTRQIKIERYWDLPSPNYDSRFDKNDLVDELQSLLTNAVNQQLVSDVPLGILLSGGLDSSLITALAAKSDKLINTFSITFPNNVNYDESKHSRLIAKYFGTNHTELAGEEFSLETLPNISKQFDEPIFDSSSIPTFMVSNLVKEKCTVALGGDGGDELFGGYDHYRRLLFLNEKFNFVPNIFRQTVSSTLNKLYKKYRGRNWIDAFGQDLTKELPRIATYFRTHERKLLLKNQSFYDAELMWSKDVPQQENLLERATRMDFKNYLCEDILVKVDRASMLNSLEVRAPLLNHKIIEFAFSKIPPQLKTTSTENKIILKLLGKKILPTDFDFNRKQGFITPLDYWFERDDWINLFEEVFYDSSQELFNHSYLKKLMNEQRNGNLQSERLFGLLMLCIWKSEYGIKM